MFRQEILKSYQVRKTKTQKAAFEAYLKELLQQDEISVEAMTFGMMKSRNLVVGDVAKAKAIFTAHYDTCAAMPLPNFITPKSFTCYLLYQLVLTLVIIAVPAIVAALIGLINEALVPLVAVLGIYLILFLIMFGPANKHTANDNTSGVTGVSFDKRRVKWWAFVVDENKKVVSLGYFIDKNDAIVARLNGEVKYYGEFAPQQHLYKQYGINATVQN